MKLHIPMTQVDSAAFNKVGYDKASKTLRVEFHSGDVHDYKGITTQRNNNLMAAKSMGGYFTAHIKGAYPSKPQ